MTPYQSTTVLICFECRRPSVRFERGWRAYLTARDEDDPEEPVEVVVLCPDCSESSSALD